MGANRYSICPKCELARLSKIEKLQKEVKDAYGKTSEQFYNELKKELVDILELKEENLREDWEFVMGENGDFEVQYSCSCEKCKWTYNFNHKENVLWHKRTAV